MLNKSDIFVDYYLGYLSFLLSKDGFVHSKISTISLFIPGSSMAPALNEKWFSQILSIDV